MDQDSAFNSGLGNVDSWFGPAGSNLLSRFLGLTVFASLFKSADPSTAYIASAVVLFVLGTFLEMGRRFFHWVYERFSVFRESSGSLSFCHGYVDNLTIL